MAQQIQLRNGTAAQWVAANPVLAVGEIGLETDTLAYKIGTGAGTWTALPYRQLTGESAALLLGALASDPSPPAAGKLTLFARSVGGRILPKWIGPSGVDTAIQPALFSNGIQLLAPSSGGSMMAFGMAAPTVVGGIVTPVLAAGNMRASTRRSTTRSAATANAAAELRSASTQCYRGESVGGRDLGGFFCLQRFAVPTTVPGQRGAFGLFSSTSAFPTTQAPYALTNGIFVGFDNTDTTMQVMSNDATGTCTKVDLGANFPAGDANAIYEFVLFARPNADSVSWRMQRLDMSVPTANGVISAAADLPSAATFLAWHAYMNNNGVAAEVNFDLMRFYLETDA